MWPAQTAHAAHNAPLLSFKRRRRPQRADRLLASLARRAPASKPTLLLPRSNSRRRDKRPLSSKPPGQAQPSRTQRKRNKRQRAPTQRHNNNNKSSRQQRLCVRPKAAQRVNSSSSSRQTSTARRKLALLPARAKTPTRRQTMEPHRSLKLNLSNRRQQLLLPAPKAAAQSQPQALAHLRECRQEQRRVSPQRWHNNSNSNNKQSQQTNTHTSTLK